MAISPYIGETVTVSTTTEEITIRLAKQQGRFGERHPHFRYTFVEESREPLTDEPSGLVLEERQSSSSGTELIEEALQHDFDTLKEEPK